jgi:hypothetical protein
MTQCAAAMMSCTAGWRAAQQGSRLFSDLLTNSTTRSTPRSPYGHIGSPDRPEMHLPIRGLNADPIVLDLVVCRVLVSVMDIAQVMPTEVSVHKRVLTLLVI